MQLWRLRLQMLIGWLAKALWARRLAGVRGQIFIADCSSK